MGTVAMEKNSGVWIRFLLKTIKTLFLYNQMLQDNSNVSRFFHKAFNKRYRNIYHVREIPSQFLGTDSTKRYIDFFMNE